MTDRPIVWNSAFLTHVKWERAINLGLQEAQYIWMSTMASLSHLFYCKKELSNHAIDHILTTCCTIVHTHTHTFSFSTSLKHRKGIIHQKKGNVFTKALSPCIQAAPASQRFDPNFDPMSFPLQLTDPEKPLSQEVPHIWEDLSKNIHDVKEVKYADILEASTQ